MLEELYAPYIRQGNPCLFMDIQSAEMVKYASNAMLACRISFMNEMARLCSHYDADIANVRRGMSTDSRIGKDFLYPGLGYGGSCFPKDTLAVIEMGRAAGIDTLLNTAVHDVNQAQRHWFIDGLRALRTGSDRFTHCDLGPRLQTTHRRYTRSTIPRSSRPCWSVGPPSSIRSGGWRTSGNWAPIWPSPTTCGGPGRRRAGDLHRMGEFKTRISRDSTTMRCPVILTAEICGTPMTWPSVASTTTASDAQASLRMPTPLKPSTEP